MASERPAVERARHERRRWPGGSPRRTIGASLLHTKRRQLRAQGLSPKMALPGRSGERDKIGIYTNRTNKRGERGLPRLRTYFSGACECEIIPRNKYRGTRQRARGAAAAAVAAAARNNGSRRRQREGSLPPLRDDRRRRQRRKRLPAKAASPPSTHAPAIYLRVSMGEIKEAV